MASPCDFRVSRTQTRAWDPCLSVLIDASCQPMTIQPTASPNRYQTHLGGYRLQLMSDRLMVDRMPASKGQTTSPAHLMTSWIWSHEDKRKTVLYRPIVASLYIVVTLLSPSWPTSVAFMAMPCPFQSCIAWNQYLVSQFSAVPWEDTAEEAPPHQLFNSVTQTQNVKKQYVANLALPTEEAGILLETKRL